MEENNFELLDIYRMMQPISSAGAERLTGGSDGITFNFWKSFFDIIMNVDAAGVLTVSQLREMLGNLTTHTTTEETKKQLLKEASYCYRMYAKNAGFMPWVSKNDPSLIYDADKTLTSFGQCFLPMGEASTIPEYIRNCDKEFGVIMCNSPLLSPATRGVDKVEMWLNYIPPLVLARCSPYIDIKFEMLRTGMSEDMPNAMSIMKFLEGATKLTSPADIAMNDANIANTTAGNVNIAGMEMFLTPQTFVNTSPQSFEQRYVDVIDKFRPFATLQSLDMSIRPEIGFITYKNGSLNFVLHDRSRLHEISDIVRPQLYGNVTLWITWGWRHPPDANNPYAQFINNNMLMREAYGITNVDMSFDEVGQVNVKMKIATRGARELEFASTTSSTLSSTVKSFNEIQSNIKKLRSALNLGNIEGVSKEVRPYMLLDAVESGTFTDMSDAQIKTAISDLKTAIAKKKITKGASPSASADADNTLHESMVELSKKLDEQLNAYFLDKDNAKLSLKKQLDATSKQASLDQFASVMNGIDPFLPSEEKLKAAKSEWPERFNDSQSINELVSSIKNVSKTSVKKTFKIKTPTGKTVDAPTTVVSLGKLLSTFTMPAVATLDDVKEVQLIFYQFNGNCGPASNLNIAEFPIDISNFLLRYSDFLHNKKSDKITLKEFFSLVSTTQVQDVRALAYGLSDFYRTYDPNKPDPVVIQGKEGKHTDAVRARQESYGAFQMPSLQMHIETLHTRISPTTAPGKVDLLQLFQSLDSNLLNRNSDALYEKILRIHVYDKTLNPYQAEAMLIRANDSDQFLTQISTKTPDGLYLVQKLINQLQRLQSIPKSSQSNPNAVDTSITSVESQIIQMIQTGQARDKNGITIDMSKVPSGAGTRRGVKDYVSRNVPTIIYGANGSTVHNASLSTKSDGLVETNNMIKSLNNAATMSPNGSGKNGLPLRVIPASMTMSSLGCPMAMPAQTYFIDFNTGTTIDALYTLTNINHSLSAGKFETTWTFAFLDGYARMEGAPFAKGIDTLTEKPKS